MSVIKSKRNESGMEFIHNARTLQIYTIKKCVAFPKRYSFYMGQPIVQMATEIHNDVKRANSIYPLNTHEAQLRRDYLLRAIAELNSMVSQVEVAAEMFHIEPDGLKYWMELIDKELRLIKGVLKEDRERYKKI